MGQESPAIAEQRAVIINREYLRWIEVPGPHRVVENGAGGWRLDVDQATVLSAHLDDDSVVRLELGADGYVVATTNEFYVAVLRDPPDIVVDVGRTPITRS